MIVEDPKPATPADPKPATPAVPATQGADVIEPQIVAIEPTGDPAQDLALRHLVKAGIAPGSDALKLAKQGDFSLLKAQAKEKGVAAGDEYIAILEAAHTRTVSDAEARKAKAQEIAVQVAGGQEQWAKVKAFVAENADESEIAEINAALRGGGVTARATVQWLVDGYRKATGDKPAPAAALPNDRAGGGSGTDNGPLSPRAYAAAVADLARKVGSGRVQSTPEYAALQRRRQAFRR